LINQGKSLIRSYAQELILKTSAKRKTAWGSVSCACTAKLWTFAFYEHAHNVFASFQFVLVFVILIIIYKLFLLSDIVKYRRYVEQRYIL